MKMQLRPGLLCAVFWAMSLFASRLGAATLTVTSPDDSGPGSLREVIALSSSGDQITFDEALSGTTIRVTGGEVLINKNLQIIGRGSKFTIISAAESPNTRVFTISPGIFVSVSNLTLTVEQIYGGGIYTEGNLRVTDSVITGNYGSGRGGAIYNAGGNLTGIRTSLRGTVETGLGAGLYNDPLGNAYLQDCVFAGSQSRGTGVGIYNAGAMTIVDGLIQGNMGTGGGASSGGGIANEGSLRIVRSVIALNRAASVGGILNFGKLDIRESLIVGNDGYWGAGGLDNGGEALLVNSTLSGNSSNYSSGGISNRGRLVAINSTVTANSANVYSPGVVGGISSYAPAVVKNSVIAGNFIMLNCPTSDSSCASDCGGSFESHGHNIIGALGDECQGFVDGQDGDMVGVAVEDILETFPQQAGPSVILADNGGSSPTVALLPDSPARDAIPTLACIDEEGNSITTDQRGVPRPQGAACDIGAFEFSAPRDTLFWMQQCREKKSAVYGEVELDGLFSAINDKSSAFPECAPASCASLEPDSSQSSWKSKASRELLAVWLNLASGRLTKGRPADLHGLSSATSVGAAVAEIEAAVCDPNASKQQYQRARDIGDVLNEGSN